MDEHEARAELLAAMQHWPDEAIARLRLPGLDYLMSSRPGTGPIAGPAGPPGKEFAGQAGPASRTSG